MEKKLSEISRPMFIMGPLILIITIFSIVMKFSGIDLTSILVMTSLYGGSILFYHGYQLRNMLSSNKFTQIETHQYLRGRPVYPREDPRKAADSHFRGRSVQPPH
jgi:hypothetical protein